MSWWGGGSKKEEEPPSEKGFIDDSGSSSFESGPNLMSGGGGGGGGGGVADFQQFSVALQQQIMVNQVITDLAHKAFEKCCTSNTRDSKLTGKEVACIHASTNKWLDTNEFMAGRLSRKQQQAAASSGKQFS